MNLQNKGINASIITDENIREFLRHLQLISNYPSGEHLLNVIERLLSRLDNSNLATKISSQDVYKKVEDWFKQRRGEYLTENRVKAMLCEIKSDRNCESLKSYNVSFERNDFNFRSSKRIYHIAAEGGYLLQVLKIYQTLQKHNCKKLYIQIDDAELLKEAINVFGLHRYAYLIVIWTKVMEESLMTYIGCKLREVLEKYQYKKFILVAQRHNKLPDYLASNSNNCDVINGSGTLEDLSRDSKESILWRKSILFQGKSVSLAELLPTQTTEDYGTIIHSEILQTLLKGEDIQVGAPIPDLDEHVRRYYVYRTFSRTFTKTLNDNEHGQVCQTQYLEAGFNRTPNGKARSERREEIIPEDSIYNVNEKFILIADGAGVGKSIVLTKLAATIKKYNPYLWVIKIELNEYTKILRDLARNGKRTVNIKELLDSRNTTKLTNPLEKYIFSVREKVVLMLDGIDEISPDYTQLILGLLQQCQKESNFAKIFVTTRSHMVEELQTILKAKPFILQPFTEQNQLDFLTSYWSHNLELKDDASKGKCKRYAKALMNIISLSHLENNKESAFISIPLHLRITAEIFQENTRLFDLTDWDGCKEYVTGNEKEPKLGQMVNVTRLYDLFVEKKRDIFIDKGNPSGNATANQALTKQFNECLVFHKSLALEVILGEDNIRCFFNNYRRGDKDVETNVLKIGVVQNLNGKLNLIHRTFADYFVAECLFAELQQNRSSEFQMFLMDKIFLLPQYNITCIFFDSLLQKVVDTLPSNILEKYQFVKQDSTLEFYKLQSKLLHFLAGEGCIHILQLILNCIDFRIITDKAVNIVDFYNTNFDEGVRENIFGNTLNILQHLTREAGINIVDEEGWTPLHYAAQNSNLKMLQFLIKQGANVNGRTNDGCTVLFYSAAFGNLSTVQYLVKLGADVKLRNHEGVTTLHAAVLYSHIDTISFLMECGVDISATCNDGSTALHTASKSGNLNAVKYLLELGIDSNIKEECGFTALHFAVQYGQLDVVTYLVEYGLNINDTTSYGSTLLHLASANGHMEITKYLLELNVDYNIKNNDGFTALHAAALYGQLSIVKFLVEYGLDFTETNIYGSTLLHSASSYGHLETVKYLLQLGVDWNIKDNDGFTVMHVAALYGQLDTVQFFVESDLDFNNTNDYGSTLLHLASVYGHLETVKYLLELRVDSTIKDCDGFTALHVAVQHGQLDTVKCFLEHGLDFNDPTSDGFTLLHLASENGHSETVKFLIDLGLDCNTENSSGLPDNKSV